MERYLFVIDYQNDFVDGALGFPGAEKLDGAIAAKVRAYGKGKVLFTRDTHFADYMDTQEGKNLPVPHCIKDTDGWRIRRELDALRKTPPIDKITFGSKDLVDILKGEPSIESITFVGLCTDICVISNVMLTKAFFPEIPLIVDAKACAGVTPESHQNALAAMKMCQVRIVNE